MFQKDKIRRPGAPRDVACYFAIGGARGDTACWLATEHVFYESINFDGVAKTPIYCVMAGSRVLSVPYVRFRALDTTNPCISNFLLSHLNQYDGLFASPSTFVFVNARGQILLNNFTPAAGRNSLPPARLGNNRHGRGKNGKAGRLPPFG